MAIDPDNPAKKRSVPVTPKAPAKPAPKQGTSNPGAVKRTPPKAAPKKPAPKPAPKNRTPPKSGSGSGSSGSPTSPVDPPLAPPPAPPEDTTPPPIPYEPPAVDPPAVDPPGTPGAPDGPGPVIDPPPAMPPPYVPPPPVGDPGTSNPGDYPYIPPPPPPETYYPDNPNLPVTPLPPDLPIGPNAPDYSGYAQLGALLKSVGLESLYTVKPDGTPTGWLWDKMQAGIDTPDELLTAVESTAEWQTRFGVIMKQRQAAAQGKPGTVMSVYQVLEYEATARGLMRAAGLPAGFYDQPTDFHELILNDVSPAELQTRVARSYNMAANVDPLVREAFDQFYGTNSEPALAAFFLSPTKSLEQVDQAARSAFTAGKAKKVGLELSKAVSEKIGSSALSEASIQDRLASAAEMKSLTVEGFREGSNLTDETLAKSTFFGDAEAKRRLEARLIGRQAVARQAVGGAVATDKGIAGAGLG